MNQNGREDVVQVACSNSGDGNGGEGEDRPDTTRAQLQCTEPGKPLAVHVEQAAVPPQSDEDGRVQRIACRQIHNGPEYRQRCGLLCLRYKAGEMDASPERT